MGYRHYFYKVSKEEVERVKDLSLDKIKEEPFYKENGYISLRNFINHQEVFEFGKLYYEDTDEQIYSTGRPLFNNDEVMEYFSENAPFIVGKEGLLKTIEIYKEKIKKYYKDMLIDGEERIVHIFGFTVKDEDIKSIDKVKKEIESKIRMWEYSKGVIDINEDNLCVTRSWLYEYEIFNLIFILKTIDWEKDTLLFYGR